MSMKRQFSPVSLARHDGGSITVLGAVVITGLIGITSFAVELGSWYAARVQLQRIADLAAIGGAFSYASNADAKMATSAADSVAQVNGAAGGSAVSWNAAAATLTDGQITASIVPSPKTAGHTAVEVTITRPTQLLLTSMFSSAGSVKLAASAWAEITPPGPGAPACVLSLDQTSGSGISVAGNPSLNLDGCTLRSNSDLNVAGSATVDTLGVYAAGTITGGSLIHTEPSPGQLFNNAGVISDPYLGDATLQSALSQLGGSGQSVSVQPNHAATLTPGTYDSIDIKGTVTLQPGTYIVNGPISINSQATVAGTGVTIISAGAVTINGGAVINLSAPLSGASSGVPGVVMASTSSSGSKINGGSSSAFQGALYFPNSDIEFTGNSKNGSSGCTQVIGNTVTFRGGANLGSNCSGAGVATINSGNPGIALVE